LQCQTPGENDMSMFGKGKSGEDLRDPTPSQYPPTVGRQISPDSPEGSSSIGANITIVGKIVGTGTVTVFGRIEGELNASDVTIAEGAQVEGNVVAQALTVAGHVKGTIHAVRAKLLGTAKVEGDIFHRSLSIDENAIFEGSSRRAEDPTGKKPNGQPAATTPAFSAPVGVTAIDGHVELNRASEPFAP
jgi:cytoskeletal protein CcmA (bactofilin family)